jgi:hypothetical protein
LPRHSIDTIAAGTHGPAAGWSYAVSTYTVVKVRKETSADGRHRHLEGVITTAGLHYTRREVVDSINAGNTWQTSTDGYSAKIHTLAFCPRASCLASPYIATDPDSTTLNNLENLPEG